MTLADHPNQQKYGATLLERFWSQVSTEEVAEDQDFEIRWGRA